MASGVVVARVSIKLSNPATGLICLGHVEFGRTSAALHCCKGLEKYMLFIVVNLPSSLIAEVLMQAHKDASLVLLHLMIPCQKRLQGV